MIDREEAAGLVSTMTRDLLRFYDERVPEQGDFPDIRVGKPVHFGDPTITVPGRIELIVMNMDKRLDPSYDYLRFLSVRVMKSREGGFTSSTCLHGRKKELREELEKLAEDPSFLVERVEQLSNGMPEETNPDIWR